MTSGGGTSFTFSGGVSEFIYNRDVNGYFLCDRGRFGYEFVNSKQRFCQPVLSGQPASAASAKKHLSERVANGSVIGIGSPRASLEANFALRTLVGPERFHSGMADDQAKLVRRGAHH